MTTEKILEQADADFEMALYELQFLTNCQKICFSPIIHQPISEWQKSKKLINQFYKN